MADFYIFNMREKLLFFLGKEKSAESINYWMPSISINGKIKTLSEKEFWGIVEIFKKEAGECKWIIGEIEELFDDYIGEGEFREIGGSRDVDIRLSDYLKPK